MTKGPENTPAQNPLENIGPTLAAGLIRQRVFQAGDIRQGLLTGSFEAATSAVQSVDQTLREADAVEFRFNEAVGNIKRELNYFPDIRVGELMGSGTEQPVAFVSYEPVRRAVSAPVVQTEAPIEASLDARPSVSVEAPIPEPVFDSLAPVVEMRTVDLSAQTAVEVDAVSLTNTQTEEAVAAAEPIIQASEVVLATEPEIASPVEVATASESDVVASTPDLPTDQSEVSISPVAEERISDSIEATEPVAETEVTVEATQSETVSLPVAEAISNEESQPTQAEKMISADEQLAAPVAVVAEDTNTEGEQANDSLISELESAQTVAEPLVTVEDEAPNSNAPEKTAENLPYDQILDKIIDGETLQVRMAAVHQAVVYLSGNIAEQQVRGKGLTILQQKLILAALDVDENGNRTNPNKETMVELVYADVLDKLRIPHERKAKKVSLIDDSDVTITQCIDRVYRALEDPDGWEDSLSAITDLLMADARTADIGKGALEKFLKIRNSEHDYKMMLKKVEEDVKKNL